MLTRHKVAIWLTLAFAGFLIAAFAGPMYANYFWPEELAPNAVFQSGPADVEEMILSFEKAKPIADTANRLTALGNFITAVAIVGLTYTLFMHFRKRNALGRNEVNEGPQQSRNAG